MKAQVTEKRNIKSIKWQYLIDTEYHRMRATVFNSGIVACSEEFLGIAEELFGTQYVEIPTEYGTTYRWPAEYVSEQYIPDFIEQVKEYVSDHFE